MSIEIVFDGPPSHVSGRFVEVEENGKSIKFGKWEERTEGFWALVLPDTVKKEGLGMYGERAKLKVGKFELCFFDGQEENGVWLEDTETGIGAQFKGEVLEKCITELWTHF